MQEYKINLKLGRDFNRTLLSSRLNRLWTWLLGRPVMLLPFEDVYARLIVRGRHDRGYQTMPLDRIVGRQGRYGEFDRSFLPRTDRSADRGKRIWRAYYQAHVTEFEVDVPLGPELDLRGLSDKEEQSDFFAWTDLIGHINRHRRRLEAEQPSRLSRDEAIAHWYDHVYGPTVTAIGHVRLPAALRHRLIAELCVAVANHQLLLTAETGQAVSIHEALHDYLRQFSWRVRLARAWKSTIRRWPMGTVGRPKPS